MNGFRVRVSPLERAAQDWGFGENLRGRHFWAGRDPHTAAEAASGLSIPRTAGRSGA
jgi:hypothetical protein